jgi:hypothetical protein
MGEEKLTSERTCCGVSPLKVPTADIVFAVSRCDVDGREVADY